MPKYRVQLSDGRIVTVQADQPPTEADILAQVGPRTQPQETAPQADSDASTWADTAINALPTAGGVVGSLVGGGKWNPLGMAGAALGGTAGEAIKQTANAVRGRMDLVPRSASEQLKSMMAAGAVQGGIEGVGRGVVAPVAKGVYGVAMRPVKALRDKYGLKTLVNEGFERGVMPTKGGLGAEKAGRAMHESRTAQRGMAEAYDTSGGARLNVTEAGTRGLAPLVKDARAGAAATGTPSTAPKITRQFLRVKKATPDMSATQMMDAKHTADAIADPAYTAARKPGGAPVEPSSKAGIAKGWSKGYRGTLNEAVGPEFAKQGQTTKALFGVQRMADSAADRPEQIANLFSIAGGAASSGGDMGEGLKDALIYRALLSPKTQAGTALLARPAALYGTRGLDALTGSNAEQMLREALLAQLTQGQP